MKFVNFESWFVIIALSGTVLSYLVTDVLHWLNDKFVNTLKLHETYEKYAAAHPLISKLMPFDKYCTAIDYSNDYSKFSKVTRPFNRLFSLSVGIFCVWPVLMSALMRYDAFSAYPVLTLICAICLMTLIRLVFDSPFDLYSTFRIEARYGFNTQTPGLWLSDTVKSYLIGCIMSSVMVCVSYYLFKYLRCTTNDIVFTTVIVAGSFTFNLLYESVYINIIAPLFNKFTPMQDGEMKTKIMKLVTDAGFSVSDIYIADMSKRTKHGNAYFCGWGSCKRIVIYDTLMSNHTDDEILAILAHEVGHLVHRDIIKTRLTDTVYSAVTVCIIVKLMLNIDMYHAFGFDWVTSDNIGDWYIIGFALAETVLDAVTWVISPIMTWFSRRMEYAADAYSKTVGYGEAMQNALVKLTADNLSTIADHPIFVKWYFGHPQMIDRINALKKKITD